MNPVVEMSLVAVCVGAAVIFLVARIVAGMRRSASSGCGGSCRCGAGTPDEQDRLGKRIELVELGGSAGIGSGKATRP
ncbi:hypothetical protein B7486_09135 [cyanobacterium TDX16]|nr:hypothetical protein B7486_09135 [cyanobacterium TDX16]